MFNFLSMFSSDTTTPKSIKTMTKEEMLNDILEDFQNDRITWEEFLEEVEIVEEMYHD